MNSHQSTRMIRDASAPSVFRAGLFEGKVALVTGGGTGIGKCIAQELASLGCSVVIASRNAERLEQAAQEIRAELPNTTTVGEIFCVSCDIRKLDQVENMVQQTLDHFHKIDFLVNNAGGQFAALADNISPKGFEAVVRLNLIGTYNVTKTVYTKYMQEHGGNIVNIIIQLANGSPMMCHSGAARAGVENLTKSLALEWASSGIRVNCIAPGVILSSGVYNYPGGSAEMFDRIAKKVTCAKRVGTMEEIAAATLFYLSPASTYTTGTTLLVDGGWHLVGSTVRVPDHDKCPLYGTSKL